MKDFQVTGTQRALKVFIFLCVIFPAFVTVTKSVLYAEFQISQSEAKSVDLDSAWFL